MCGLVGIAGKLLAKDESTMKTLLLIDVLRGADSTGLAAVRSANKEAKISKLASHPLDLFDRADFKEALNGALSTVFIGHNRAATLGMVSRVNAHPFECGNIVGAHNGTLKGTSFYDLKKKLGQEFGTDSEAIFASINEFGLKETVSMLEGAWSLVWYDRSNNTLNFLRNKERPMYFAYSKEFDRIFWASEWEMIAAAFSLRPNGTELYAEKKTGYEYWPTDEDVHYCFDVDKLKSGSAKPKPTVKTVKGKEPAPVSSTSSVTPFRDRTNSTNSTMTSLGTTNGGNTQVRGGTGQTEKPVSLIHLFGSMDNPYAGLFSKEKFEEIAKYGCSWCQKHIDYGDTGILIHERDEIILCKECTEGDEKTNHIHLPSTNFQSLL